MTDSLAGVEGGELVPVVAVLVANESTSDVEASLIALHGQSYGALRVLIAADSQMVAEVEAMIAQDSHHLDHDHLDIVAEVGSATLTDVANEATGLVDGDNGLFWLIESGTIPEPHALHHLVAEILEANAAVVGPKIVNADDANRLQAVGITVDRLGERVEPLNLDEADQEQHDRVRDVLAVDASGMLFRADLFRELGGFASPMSAGTADVELCWRAHCAGARVMVVPDAVIARSHERIAALIASRSASRSQVVRDEVDTVLVTASAQYLAAPSNAVSLCFGSSLASSSAQLDLQRGVLRQYFLRRFVFGRYESDASSCASWGWYPKQISSLLYPITSRLTLIVKIRDDGDAVAADAGGQAARTNLRSDLGLVSPLWGCSLAQEVHSLSVPGVGGWLSKHKLREDGSGGSVGFQRCGSHDGNRRRSCCARCLGAAPLVGSLLTGWGLESEPSFWLSIQRLAGVTDSAASGCCAGDLPAGPIVPSMLGADTAAFAVYAVLP